MSRDERAVATAIVRRLREAGHEAYFVGGCVREMVLGHAPEDHDVTTDATPDRVVELFPRVVEVGKQFGVVMVVEDGVVVEVATYRTEGSYTDGRRPDSVSFSTAAEDVSRRDFTINALLYDPIEDRIVDHVGGVADIQARLLRTVGEARTRFEEDRLRMLRAVRFTARLGFRLHEDARAACRDLAPKVTTVSVERTRDELTRMLAHPSRAAAVALLRELRLLDHVLPEVGELAERRGGGASASALDATIAALARLAPDASAEAAWATLLHDTDAPADIARRLRMSRAEIARIGQIAGFVRQDRCGQTAQDWNVPRVRRFVAEAAFPDALAVARAIDAAAPGVAALDAALEQWGRELPAPLVNGDDVVAAGVPRGQGLGRALARLRDEQLAGAITTREQALARAVELASRE